MTDWVAILPEVDRLVRLWEHPPADDPSASTTRLRAALARLKDGDVAALPEILATAGDDPRLLEEAGREVFAWLRGPGRPVDNVRLRLELLRMRRLHAEAVVERSRLPAWEELEAEAEPEDLPLRDIVARLREHEELLRGAWILRRRCEHLPRWRHWDIFVELRPGLLLGKTDVPDHVAAIIDTIRDGLGELWIDCTTFAVHAHPVFVPGSLLKQVRETGTPLLAPSGKDPASLPLPFALRPSLAEADPDTADLVTERPDPSGSALPQDAEQVEHARTGLSPAENEDEDAPASLPAPLAAALDRFRALRAEIALPPGGRRAMVLGLGLLPMIMGWQIFVSNTETHARLAALERHHQQLMKERIWRREDGAHAEDPLKTFETYRKALQEMDISPTLPIYTAATRAHLTGRFRSRTGMQAEWAGLFRCTGAEVHRQNDRAVIVFREKDHACAPYFLLREGGRWRIDLVSRKRFVTEWQGRWQWVGGHPPAAWAFAFHPDLRPAEEHTAQEGPQPPAQRAAIVPRQDSAGRI